MALLEVSTRKKWMKYVGYEYTKKGILQMQTDYFVRKQDKDGIYGPDTDKLLRHLHHVKKYTKNFSPKEFRCPCGECTGYPTWMRVKELTHLQEIRTHYKKPMTITSGLRCKVQNAKVNGWDKSLHLKGRACDFYIPGVTDTLPHRRKAVRYIINLKYHRYVYGQGIYAYDKIGYIEAKGMGNALHVDVE